MVVALDELPYDVLEVVASHVAGHLDDPEERQHNLLLLARCAPAFVAPAQRQLTMHLWLNGFERAALLWLGHLGPNEQPFVESLEVKLRGRPSSGMKPETLLGVISRCRGLETLVFGAMREADLAAPHSASKAIPWCHGSDSPLQLASPLDLWSMPARTRRPTRSPSQESPLSSYARQCNFASSTRSHNYAPPPFVRSSSSDAITRTPRFPNSAS